jgi:hypothetical protein
LDSTEEDQITEKREGRKEEHEEEMKNVGIIRISFGFE